MKNTLNLFCLTFCSVLCGSLSPASAQDAKAILKQAADQAGGLENLRKLRTFAISVKNPEIVEVHVIRLSTRMSYFRALMPDKTSLEIVLAQQNTFIVERSKEGKAMKVEELNPTEAREAAYDRDMFLLPVLLPFFHDDEAATPKFEGTSNNGHPLISVTLPKAPQSHGQAVRYMLKFSKKTGRLVGAKSVIPAGPNKGKQRAIIFSNYKAVKNLSLPRQIRYKVDGDPVRTINFKIKLDAKFAVTRFLKPKIKQHKGDSK